MDRAFTLRVALVATLTLLGSAAIVRQWIYRRRYPFFLFTVFNTYFAVTVGAQLDLDVPADTQHAYLLVVTSLAVLVYTLAFLSPGRVRAADEAWAARPMQETGRGVVALWLVLGASVAVTIVFYQWLVGYNLVSLLVRGTTSADFVSLRLASYAGERYTGAGVVNQFKNTLLPISFLSLIVVLARERGRALAFLFAVVAAPLFAWAILGTGQRAYAFFTLVGLFLFAWHSGSRLPVFPTAVGIALFLVAFAFLSQVLGRTQGVSPGEVLAQFADRLLVSNQRATIEGFRWIAEREVTYFAEWGAALRGLVPGLEGSSLSNEIHRQLFGSSRGTAPVSLWASVYHNAGWVLTPFIALAVCRIVDYSQAVLLWTRKTAPSLMVFAFLSLYVMLLPLTSPVQILNNGLLAIFLFYLVLAVRLSRRGVALTVGGGQ